jgi:hypothetical protein
MTGCSEGSNLKWSQGPREIEGGEILPVLQMAMLGNLPNTTLKDAVFAYPVQAESINNLSMALDG